MDLGVIGQPLELLYTPGAIVAGLLYAYLPLMILPLYASIERLDPELREASANLGARPARTFMSVTLPLTLPGVLIGSIFVLPSEGREGTAQLRMLYVEPEARGLGLGTTLVRQVVEFSRASGYRRVRLWTQSVLVSARRIYEAVGFQCVETEKHHSFGKDLVAETWDLKL